MKTFLITGASGDLGSAIANKVASELKTDCTIILHYNSNKSKAQKIADEISKKYGSITECVGADFTSLQSTQKMIDNISKKYQVDYLVNNAGYVVDQELQDRTAKTFEDTLRCNLVVPFMLSKAFGSSMNVRGGGGKIVNISSTNGINYNSPESIDYDASKAGLINLTKNFALSYDKVNVNCVCPHWINTKFNSELPSQFLKEEADKIINGRFAEPEEIAEFIWFLLSDKSNYLTGHVYQFSSYKY